MQIKRRDRVKNIRGKSPGKPKKNVTDNVQSGVFVENFKKNKRTCVWLFRKKKNTKPLRIQTKMEDGVRRYRHLAASVRTARRGRRLLIESAEEQKNILSLTFKSEFLSVKGAKNGAKWTAWPDRTLFGQLWTEVHPTWWEITSPASFGFTVNRWLIRIRFKKALD